MRARTKVVVALEILFESWWHELIGRPEKMLKESNDVLNLKYPRGKK